VSSLGMSSSLVSTMPSTPGQWLMGEVSMFGESKLANLFLFYPTSAALLEGLAWGSRVPLDCTTALAPEDFSFLGQDWTNLVALVKASAPMRALIVGEGTCGKTSLVKAVCKAAGVNAVSPEGGKSWSHTWSYALTSIHTQAASGCSEVAVLDSMDAVLGLDKDDNALMVTLRSRESRSQMRMPEIWVVQSFACLNAQALAGFDLVVRVGAMPLARRIDMAKGLFPEEMAKRVAQSCATPGEIQSLARWSEVTGQTDWTCLSTRLSSVQQAIALSKKSAGELPVTIFPPQANHAGFSEVVGQDRLVQQARCAIGGLRDPDRFKELGGKVPKGILLKGGPGMGKTHLARAMAGEAGVPLLLADSAAMAQSPELIGAVFAEARRQAPCLLFLDELDAVGTSARGAMGGSPDPQRQAILNRLLMELAGFTDLDGVLVVGATHRAELLDSALVRSGRLGLHMHLEEPTRHSREALWRHYAQDIKCADVINWERLGRISAGMTPADIAQAVNHAALMAGSEDCRCVGYKHFVEAVDQVLWKGDEVELPMLEDERWRTAVHEAGHALLAWHAHQDIERVSIRPRSIALGFVRTLPEEGRYGMEPANIVAQMAMVFGGLAAETVVFGNHSTGVSSDLQQARKLARLAVRSAGMEKELPAGTPGFFEPEMSQAMMVQAEGLEIKMLNRLREAATGWLRNHVDVLKRFAQLLVEQREMDGQEVQRWLDGNLQRSEDGTADANAVGVLAVAQSWPASMGGVAAQERHSPVQEG